MRISKAKNVFWRINLGLRLEDLIAQHTDILSERNIKTPVDVWYELGSNLSSLPDLALGLRDYKSHERAGLIRVFNPHFREIQELDLEIAGKEDVLMKFITQRNYDHSILATEKRFSQRRVMEDELNALQLKRSVLPAVNSIPADFFRGIADSELEELGLIVRGEFVSTLTERGLAITSEIQDLSHLVSERIGRQHENIDKALIESLWKNAKFIYLEKRRKGLWSRAMGR